MVKRGVITRRHARHVEIPNEAIMKNDVAKSSILTEMKRNLKMPTLFEKIQCLMGLKAVTRIVLSESLDHTAIQSWPKLSANQKRAANVLTGTLLGCFASQFLKSTPHFVDLNNAAD